MLLSEPPNNVAAGRDSLSSGGSAVCGDCAPQLPPIQVISTSVSTAVDLCMATVTCFSYRRLLYAPYQVHKRYGIRGPRPTPFWGSYWDIKKMVRKPVDSMPLFANETV